jgi:hypothetical protein
MHLRRFEYPEAKRFRLPADGRRLEWQQNRDVWPRQLLGGPRILLLRERRLIGQCADREV